MRQGKWLLAIGGIAVLGMMAGLWLAGALRAQRGTPAVQSPTSTPVPSAFATGETLFHVHCASCHGLSAVGTEQGPSLLSRVYVPSHHSDASFYLAVQQGVRAHHWLYGNMPALAHVTQDEVAQIIAYVRWLQEQAGIR
jgi:mono/diheme cytochrome c family protein